MNMVCVKCMSTADREQPTPCSQQTLLRWGHTHVRNAPRSDTSDVGSGHLLHQVTCRLDDRSRKGKAPNDRGLKGLTQALKWHDLALWQRL